MSSSRPPTNQQIISFLQRYSALMEFSGANPFRVRAFANAARIIEELKVDAAKMALEGTLTEIDGVGKGVAEFVAEFADTGSTVAYDEFTEHIPETLLDLLRIPGLGTKKVKALYDALEIATLEELDSACQNGRLDSLPGFGAKTQQNILKGIAGLKRFVGQFRLDQAILQAEALYLHLEEHPATIRISVAGSLRRRKEVVKDIDIVISCTDPAAVSEAFVTHEEVEDVVAWGKRKTSVRLRSGIQVDLRIVEDDLFPCILHHFTGSKDHNVLMRSRALAMGLHLNEYGLFRDDEKILTCKSEEDLFRALRLHYVPPELREGLGEVDAAEKGDLPELVTDSDIRGMLHVHTSYSDGNDNLQEMVEAVRERGYEYVAICDHSKSAGYAFGMKAEDVRQQQEEIDALNAARCDDFYIFKGIECDILKDGSLDYDDELLATFDLVVVAIHNPMNMDEAQMTKRIIRALEHPASHILAHPTGRILLEREGYAIDIAEVLAAAAANGVAIELNAHPHRLDLDWRQLRRANELGAKVAINTDAHRQSNLDHLHLGVGIGRKAWLTSEDVINCLDTESLRQYLTNGQRYH
ncbi:MAG: DNA polymerase/3'-5' exonuclease PolX [Candidatus Latescibacterota bacterium]|nr:DNA polymerase/3'-5' exonuclease PolX [Candidatus Latescibacterota bacterium]